MAAQIHPSAHIGFCMIGARTKVWQFASVIRGAVLGEDCSVAAGAIVDGSFVGDRCIISHCAFIDPGIRIGNDVFIGPQVSLCNDFWPRADKTGWFDMAELVEGNVVVSAIENGASIGANVVVLPGVRIGERAMIAAGSVVARNVPADTLYRRDSSMVAIDPKRPIERKRTID